MNNFFMYPFLEPQFPTICDKPPTLYAFMNSIVNFNQPADAQVKIKDLPSASRTRIFNFQYPLSDKVKREDFEKGILQHFMMRRIGFDTFTLFQIQLDNKLNTIMPTYNKLFDMLDGWDVFSDGEVVTTETTDTNKTDATTQSTITNDTMTDNRFSDTPENEIQKIKDGKYMSEYTYNQQTNNNISDGSNTSNGTFTHNETIKRSPADKIKAYKEYNDSVHSIYQMIYNDLEELFYGLC